MDSLAGKYRQPAGGGSMARLGIKVSGLNNTR